MTLFVFTLENANKINLKFVILYNIDRRFSSGDDAADIFLLNNNKNERSDIYTHTHTPSTIFIDPLH